MRARFTSLCLLYLPCVPYLHTCSACLLPIPIYGKVISLRHFKEEVRKVNKGTECGVILNDATDLKAGDLLTCYEVVSRKIGLYDSAEEGGGQQKRTTEDDDDDDDDS